jgi:hypothetical protein
MPKDDPPKLSDEDEKDDEPTKVLDWDRAMRKSIEPAEKPEEEDDDDDEPTKVLDWDRAMRKSLEEPATPAIGGARRAEHPTKDDKPKK